jgi:hypothetical protein
MNNVITKLSIILIFLSYLLIIKKVQIEIEVELLKV